MDTNKHSGTSNVSPTSGLRPFALNDLVAGLLLLGCLLTIEPGYGQTTVQPDAPLPAQPLRVLTWWKSGADHKAADILSDRLAKDNIQWHDMVFPPGSGDPKVDLKKWMLSGLAPDMVQLKGPLISQWFDQGLINEFKPLPGGAPGSGKWDKALFPAVTDLVRKNGHLLAIPLGVHRMNLVFYNRAEFAKLGLRPPVNWDEFIVDANKLQKDGIIPLAQSAQPWQLAALFETLLLSESSPEFYKRAFVHKDPSTFADNRFGRALYRLRILKKYMPSPVKELSWVDATRMVINGNAGMIVMGDFAKGELNAGGYTTDVNFGCAAVPNTANYHIYSIDTLVMLKNNLVPPELADKIAQLFESPNVQADYNIAKGSVSVLRNADQIKMDSCARNSWNVFSRGSSAQAPSLAHDMIADSQFSDAVTAEIVRFFTDDSIKVTETQRRMASIARSSRWQY